MICATVAKNVHLRAARAFWIDDVVVSRVTTANGRRYEITVCYTDHNGTDVRSRHNTPLYTDKATALEAARDIANYINQNLKPPMKIEVGYEDNDC